MGKPGKQQNKQQVKPTIHRKPSGKAAAIHPRHQQREPAALGQVPTKDRLNQFAYDHAPQLLMWIDSQGKCVSANKTALEALGYVVADFVKKCIWEIDPAMNAAKWDQFLNGLKRSGRVEVDGFFRTKGGQERRFETVATYAKFDGRALALICARELSDLQDSDSLRVLGQLAGGIAHDFNNLLMIVHSCTQMILHQAGDNETIVKYAGEIGQAVDRGSVATTQLLAFSHKQLQGAHSADSNEAEKR